MNIFFDTEFNDNCAEAPERSDLISIGIVRADGETLYRESDEFDWSLAGAWLHEYVRPTLVGGECLMSLDRIRDDIADFLSFDQVPEPKFWAHYACYDWVLLCRLFGGLMKIPAHWPKYCLDVKPLADSIGNLVLPKQPPDEKHNALADARWVAEAWSYLDEQMRATSVV